MSKGSHTLDDMTLLIVVGGALFVGYQVYQTIKGVTQGVSNAVNSTENSLANFDQNIGLGPLDNFISGLFNPPATTP